MATTTSTQHDTPDPDQRRNAITQARTGEWHARGVIIALARRTLNGTLTSEQRADLRLLIEVAETRPDELTRTEALPVHGGTTGECRDCGKDRCGCAYAGMGATTQ